MIMMKDIVREGHPALRAVAEEVQIPITEEDKTIILDMMQFLINSQNPEMRAKYNLREGVGLAAPQIAVGKRMIAVHCEDDEGVLYSHGLFNPKLISHSVEMTHLPGGEGCLSVDRNVEGIVPRYARIKLKGINLQGEEVLLKLKGFPSIVFQHELDHLDGVMFYDRIEDYQGPKFK